MAERKKPTKRAGKEAASVARKDAPPETAAAERGRFIESIIDLSPDILYIYDLVDRRNVYSNKGIETVLGYAPEEVQAMGGRLVPALMHPDDLKTYAEETVPRYAQAQDGAPIKHRFRMRHRSGDWRWLDCSEVIYTRDPDGSPRQIFGVVHDITERMLAEEALRERERQFAESQRIAHIGSWEHNLTSGQVVWSDELFRLLGLDPRQDPADVKVFFDMIHPDDRPVMKKAIDETVRTGKHFSVDYRLVLPDGTTRTLHAQAELKRDVTGAQLVLSGTGQDITERKQAEEKLRESRNTLETVIDAAPT